MSIVINNVKACYELRSALYNAVESIDVKRRRIRDIDDTLIVLWTERRAEKAGKPMRVKRASNEHLRLAKGKKNL